MEIQAEEIQRRVEAALEAMSAGDDDVMTLRNTELKDRFPAHVVDSWLGHSERVSRENSLMVTDEHFKQAVQNPVQKGSESGRNDPQPVEPSDMAGGGVSGLLAAITIVWGELADCRQSLLPCRRDHHR